MRLRRLKSYTTADSWEVASLAGARQLASRHLPRSWSASLSGCGVAAACRGDSLRRSTILLLRLLRGTDTAQGYHPVGAGARSHLAHRPVPHLGNG